MIEEACLAFSLRQQNQTFALILKEKVQTNPASGFSACYALSTYMVYHFPMINLTPDPSQTPQIHLDHNEKSQYLSHHPLLQFWATYFQRLILDGNAARVGNTIYFNAELKKQQFEKFDSQSILFKTLTVQNKKSVGRFSKIQELFELQKIQESGKKIGFMEVSSIQLITDLYIPKKNAGCLVIGCIFNNEIWKKYLLLNQQIPSVQTLKSFDVIIMPGSPYSVLNLHQQFDVFIKRTLQAFKQSQKLKLMGICYSHQLISLKAGSQVVRKERYIGLETIEFNNQVLQKYTFFQPLRNYKQAFVLDKYHEDHVESVPEGYELFAHSKSAKIQGLIHKSGRILTFQFHPEYQVQFDIGLEIRSRKYKNIIDQPWVYKRPSQQDLERHQKSVRVLRQCLMKFIAE